MGGNALAPQGIQTRRIDAHEYHVDLIPSVRQRLASVFPTIPNEAIRAYRDKPDFGDLGILIERERLPGDWVGRVLTAFKPQAHVKNANVLSFDHSGVQIDLITQPALDYDFARNYFAWNDLGNLIGRTARNMGFKFGHDGLFHREYDPDNDSHLIAETLVTRDFDAALSFLGHDPDRFREGFDGLDDVYAFAVDTRFFRPDVFHLENRSNTDRTRDRERPSYQGFLRFLDDRPARPADKRRIDCDGQLARAEAQFPAFAERRLTVLTKHEMECRYRACFNDDLVGHLTGLSGQALGHAMARVVEQAGGEAPLRARLLQSDDPERLLADMLGVEPPEPHEDLASPDFG